MIGRSMRRSTGLHITLDQRDPAKKGESMPSLALRQNIPTSNFVSRLSSCSLSSVASTIDTDRRLDIFTSGSGRWNSKIPCHYRILLIDHKAFRLYNTELLRISMDSVATCNKEVTTFLRRSRTIRLGHATLDGW